MDIPAGSNAAVALGAEGVGLVAALIAAVAFGGDDGDLAALHLTALDVADVLGGGAGVGGVEDHIAGFGQVFALAALGL